MNTSNATVTYIGVDVSKACLDVAQPTRSRPQRWPNQPTAMLPLLQELPPGSHLVVEATGGYERALRQACHAAGHPISIVNPARVRHFAKAQGRLAKTDAHDARLLQHFGERCTPPPIAPVPPDQQELAALVQAREHLVALQTQITNSLEHATLKAVRQSLLALQRSLGTQLTKLEAALAACVQRSASLRSRNELLQAQIGIGPQIAATLLAYLPELGHANRQQIASLAGLAPHPWESGQMQAHRHLRGGRPKVRRALYLATLTLTRSTTAPQAAFYRRLRAAGKPAKVALLATARKLLLHLNFSLKQLSA